MKHKTLQRLLALCLSLATVAALTVTPAFAKPDVEPGIDPDIIEGTGTFHSSLGDRGKIILNWTLSDGVLIVTGDTRANPDMSFRPRITNDSVRTVIFGENVTSMNSIENCPNLETVIYMTGSEYDTQNGYVEELDSRCIVSNCPNFQTLILNASLKPYGMPTVSLKGATLDSLHENSGWKHVPGSGRFNYTYAPVANAYCLNTVYGSDFEADVAAVADLLKTDVCMNDAAWAMLPEVLGGKAANPDLTEFVNDLPDGHIVSAWAKADVDSAYAANRLGVTVEAIHDMTQPITRGQFCVLLQAMHGNGGRYRPANFKSYTVVNPWYLFKDYDPTTVNEETATCVGSLNHMNVINGYGDGEAKDVIFGYNDPITREQAATIMARYYKDYTYHVIELDTNPVAYTDTISDWAKDNVYAMTNLGVMGGYGDGVFGARDSLTVEQAIVMTQRMLLIETSKYHTYPDFTWGDRDPAAYTSIAQPVATPTPTPTPTPEPTPTPTPTPTPEPTETAAPKKGTLTLRSSGEGEFFISADGKTLSTYGALGSGEGTIYTVQPDGTVKAMCPYYREPAYYDRVILILLTPWSTQEEIAWDSDHYADYAREPKNPTTTPTPEPTPTPTAKTSTVPAPAVTTADLWAAYDSGYYPTYVDDKGFTWVCVGYEHVTPIFKENRLSWALYVNGEAVHSTPDPVGVAGRPELGLYSWQATLNYLSGMIDLQYSPADQTEADKAPRPID